MFNEVEKLMLKNGMICPTCQVKGLKDFGYSTTLAAAQNFEDEDGHYHEHDGNHVTGYGTCLNDHQFQLTVFNSCWCGWTQSPDKPFGTKVVLQKNPTHGVLGIHTSITENEKGGLNIHPQTFYKNW